jgi:protein ImuA
MVVFPAPKIAVQSQPSALAHLREKIDGLESFRSRFTHMVPVCDAIDGSLPGRGLPLGCVHEVKGAGLASPIAFASLLSTRIARKGSILYVAPDRSFYPLGLLPGIKLDEWVHVSVRRPKDLAWTILEAIRCPETKAVLGILKTADLTFCRRLHLAAESSGATGFLIHQATSSSIASTITRWQISPMKSPSGRGFSESFWQLELLYCRGGRPGKWPVVWRHSGLEFLGTASEISTRPIQRITRISETVLAG